MYLGSYNPNGSFPTANHACRSSGAELRSCPVRVAIRPVHARRASDSHLCRPRSHGSMHVSKRHQACSACINGSHMSAACPPGGDIKRCCISFKKAGDREGVPSPRFKLERHARPRVQCALTFNRHGAVQAQHRSMDFSSSSSAAVTSSLTRVAYIR
jgi:hypothetical protein